jgi:predicted nucleic acid-binding protein
VIYVDSSVVLAHLLSETRSPVDEFWSNETVSSRLMEYEVLNRLNSERLGPEVTAAAGALIASVQLLDLSVGILARARETFPMRVRTLDAHHLATMDFLRAHGQSIEVATYDERLAAAAAALGFPRVAL